MILFIVEDVVDKSCAMLRGSIEMIKVYVWPDNSWVRASEYEEILYQWAGDDYRTVYFPDTATDEDIDNEVNGVANT